MYDQDLDSSGGFAGDQYPTAGIPDGYWINPQTGQLEPRPTAPTAAETEANRAAIQAQIDQLQPGVPEELPTIWPNTDTGGGGDGSTFGQGGAGGGSGFQFPQFNPSIYQPGPQFQPGQFQAPTPFSYGDFSYDSFKAPTLEEAQNQPGYKFALDQGRKALENSAAARGVLRTGGTLKDLFSWGDKFGEQNYGNVFNQDLQGYTTNRSNAFDTYNTNRNNAADAYRTNYGISKDVFDTNYGTSKDAYSLNNQSALDTYDRLFQAQSAAFNPNFQAASLKFSDLYNRDRDKLNALTGLAGLGA